MKIETIFNLPENFAINKFSLTFKDKNFESTFISDFFYSALQSQRLSIIVSLFFYSVFGILDLFLYTGDALRNILIIRFGIGFPVTLTLIGLSFTQIFKKYWQIIMALAISIVGLTIVGIIIAMPPPIRDYNFPGLMLVLFFAFVVVKLRFIYAIFSSFSITIAYMIAALTLTDVPFTNYFNNSFFFLATNFLGLYSNYMIEMYERKEFFLRMTLEQEKNNVRELLHKEQSVSQIKTRFINVTSHVFRNPLTAIMSSSQILKDLFSKEDNESATKFNRYINESANEILNVLNRVQFLTKYESGEITKFPISVDLNSIIDKLISKLTNNELKKITIEKAFFNKNTMLITDVNIIEIAIMELLSNAIKHSPVNSIIRIITNQKDDFTSIKIVDSGYGFEPELFNSIDTSYNYSKDTLITGFGLGFALLKICLIILESEVKFYRNVDEGMTSELLIKNSFLN